LTPTDVQLVREVLARELQTINEYEQAAAQAQSEEVRAFLLHLADEEKEHVAEATQVIRRLDAAQERRFQADTSVTHFVTGKPASSASIARSVESAGSTKLSATISKSPDLPSQPLSPRAAMALAELIHPKPSGFTVGPLRKSSS
jgi:rubrerythrin